jgi:hypothetical protein
MSSNTGSFGNLFGKSFKPSHKRERGTDEETMSTTGGGQEQEPEVVWEAANLMEAQIVKGRLENEGIPAIIRGEAVGQIYGLTTGNLAATDVLVPAPLAEKARDILATDVVWDDVDFDAVEDEADGESDD